MPKKKKTKAEKAAYAKAYAKRLTHGKVMDMYAAAGAALDRTARYVHSGQVEDLMHVSQDYAGISIAGDMTLHNLVRGYGGPLFNQAEREAYKFLGITRPRSKIENVNDAIDYLVYHGAAGIKAWERRDDLAESHRSFYKTHFGIDLTVGGLGAIDPEEMIWLKEIPYIVSKKIRQIPAIRKALKKLNFKFGG